MTQISVLSTSDRRSISASVPTVIRRPSSIPFSVNGTSEEKALQSAWPSATIKRLAGTCQFSSSRLRTQATGRITLTIRNLYDGLPVRRVSSCDVATAWEFLRTESSSHTSSRQLIHQLQQSRNSERAVHGSNMFCSIGFVAASGSHDQWPGAAVAKNVDARRVVESCFGDANDGCGLTEHLK